eukprot:jgi/Bigna1/144639/aug1.89_g19347
MYRSSSKNSTQIGSGTYGHVFEGVGPDGKKVALKRIKKEKDKEGFPITAIREIKFLKNIHHENIVNLVDVVSSPGAGGKSVYMVFEYCDHDLTGLLDTDPPTIFEPSQIKYYIKCILEALYYLHKSNILHRDIKGANILISNNGDVKLADFGLARAHDKRGDYTNRVVTLWYRAPELLLGANKYDSKIDIWSAGCVFAEMLRRGKTLFRGKTELESLQEIYKICGTPDQNDWPQASQYSWYLKPISMPRRLREEFASQDQYAVDLLDHLLVLNPEKRFSAGEALDHM